MRQRAWLAWRSPPRLRRWRVVWPLEAGRGLAPQRAAKDASLWRRWGLSPAAMRSAAAVSGPTPWAASRAGLAAAHRARSSPSRAAISALSAWWRLARLRSARLAADERVGGGGRSQAGAGVDEGAAAVAAEVVFERLGGGDEEAVDLVVCLCAGLDRGAARDGEHADRLDGAVVGFGHGGGVAGEGAARRGCGVDGVGFADAAAGLAVGAVHLHHTDAGRGEVARQAGAVAAGAGYADTAHGTPGGQLAVAGGVRRERRCRQQRPGGINSGGDMDITVRVDPADDLGVLLGHNGAALLRAQTMDMGTTGRDGGQDTHGVQHRAPDLLEWGQHPGPDGDVGCEVGDRLGSHAPCPLRCGSLIACRAGRRPLRRGSVEA